VSKDLAPVPFVCVVWNDAHGSATGEYTTEEIIRSHHDPMAIRTFGLLVHDDDRGLTIASEITNPDSGDEPVFRGIGFIPRGMLREVIMLGTPKRPAQKRKAKE
jgi:hypothetical protein